MFKSIQQLERRDLLAVFNVNSILDTPDANLLDGIASDAAGNTTLRAAIMQANATTANDTINIPAGTYRLTIAGRLENAAARGDLDVVNETIGGSLTINGAGSALTTIDARPNSTTTAGIDRVFDFLTGSRVNLSGMTITGGLATDSGLFPGDAQGGGILSNTSNLAYSNLVVSANEARGEAGFAGAGGGIYSRAGTTTLSNVVVRDNRAVGSVGSVGAAGLDGLGGGIFSNGVTWTLVGMSTVANNQAIGGNGGDSVEAIAAGRGGHALGGGIYDIGGSWDNNLTPDPNDPGLNASTISGNQAMGGQGGMGTPFSPPIGAPVLPGGVGGNAEGGGIYALGDSWTMLNSTISTNSVRGGRGGTGRAGAGGAGGGGVGAGMAITIGSTVDISYVTVALNQAAGGQGGTGSTTGANGEGKAGGIFHDDSGSVTLLSTIVATNVAPLHPDVSGEFLTAGHNLIGNTTGSDDFSAAMDDLVGTEASPINPVLGPLQNNGGPTSTHALLTGSPAIDAADPANFPPVDQRSVTRPLNGDGVGAALPDIGAFEAPEVMVPKLKLHLQKFVKSAPPTPNAGDDLCATIGKPREVTFRYTGGGPSATNTHQQPGKYSVSGDPMNAPLVFIRVSSSSNASSTSGVFFSGNVPLDGLFTAKAVNGDLTTFRSDTFIHIFDPSMHLLQTVGYHTSCSAPIVLGDVTGGVTLNSVVGVSGSATLPPAGPPGDFGEDANTAPGPTFQLGESVIWTYVVTNPGMVPGTNVEVTDDNETPGNPFDDFRPAPVTVTVGAAKFNVGDLDRDNQLDPGESWIFSATQVVTVQGQHRNVGKVTAAGNSHTVAATDPAHFFVPSVCKDISLTGSSSTSGSAGNIRLFAAGETQVKVSAFSRDKTTKAWAPAYLGSYSGGLGVTDTSEGSGGSNQHTLDNGGRHNYVLFEFSQSVVVDKAFLGYVVGDSDLRIWIGTFPNPFASHLTLSDSVLSSFGFTEVNSGAGSTRWANLNAGGVVGNALVIAARTDDSANDDRVKIAKLKVCPVSALPAAAINVEKATNGVDSDQTPGPSLSVGSEATFTYAVRNYGSVALSNVTIKDDNGTPDSATDDLTPTPVLAAGFNAGDTNQNDQLDLTEVWQYLASRTVTPGQYTNTAHVAAVSADGRTLRDSDSSYHFGVENRPAIDIEKFVKGGTSQQQAGVDLCDDHGKPLTLKFVYSGGGPDATNTHQPPGKYVVTGDPNDAATTYIRVTDSATPSSTSNVFFFGRVNLNEEFTFSTADAGDTRFASNTFLHIFADSAATSLLQTVQYHTSCSAPIVLGDVVGGVTLTGFIGEDAVLLTVAPPQSTVDVGVDADEPNGPSINVGAQVVWTYRVANVGNEPLENIQVNDDNGTSGTADDFSPPPILSGGFNIGDLNRNGLMETGESWYYRAVDQVMLDGLFKNEGRVTAESTGTSTPVSDDDDAHYLGTLPATDTRQAGQYPQMLVMRFTPDNVLRHSQSSGKVSVTGNLNGVTNVLIKATNKAKHNDSNARVYFNGPVSSGGIFTIDADRAGQDKLDSTTYVHIYRTNGQLLGTIRFESSRSQPLVLGDQFGRIKLIGFVGEKGATFGVQPAAALASDLQKKTTFDGKRIVLELTNTSSDRFATIEAMSLQWAYKNKNLVSIKIDDQTIFDKSTAPNSVTISTFKGSQETRRFGPGTIARLTFEFQSTASKAAGDFKLKLDLGSGLEPIL